jgi:hypothetical protein
MNLQRPVAASLCEARVGATPEAIGQRSPRRPQGGGCRTGCVTVTPAMARAPPLFYPQRGEVLHHGNQFGELDRLGDVHLKAGAQRPDAIFAAGHRS